MIIGQEKPSLDSMSHFGVKGMKWGFRKVEQPTNPNYTARKQENDRQAHGTRGVKRINRRMNEGMSREDAQSRERVRRNYQRLGLLGAAFAAQMLIDSGGLQTAGLYIKNRAEANRAASKVADSMLKIGTQANPLKYAKPKRGAYKITTMN